MKFSSIKGFGIAALLLLCGYMVAFIPAANTYVGSYSSSTTYPRYYTKLDTVTNTGTDTFKISIPATCTSITFQNNVLKCTGTPAGQTILYASVDGVNYGAALNTTSITVSSTTVPQVIQYMVNSTFGGNPYTNYMWVYTGVGTMTTSWQGYVLIR